MSKPINVAIFERAFELIRDEKGWCQGTTAKDKNGCSTAAQYEKAVSFCTYGAILRARYEITGSTKAVTVGDHVLDALDSAARELGKSGAISYNDYNTHAEVMAMWEKAKEKVL